MGNKGIKYAGLNSKTSCSEVLSNKDLENKHIMITGASLGGLGYSAALSLFNANAEVSIIGRNEKNMNDAINEIEKQRKEGCKGKMNSYLVDLAKQSDVKKFGNGFKGEVDVLICNAGMMLNKRVITEDGFELVMATNHFGHFSLAVLFINNGNFKENGRIVMLSSLGNRIGNIKDFSKINYDKKDYGLGYQAYGNSKLANLMFTIELNRRLKESGSKIIINCLHPGMIKTRMGRDVKGFTSFVNGWIFGPIMKYFGKTLSQGSATTVFLSVDERITEGGGYFIDFEKRLDYNSQAKDADLLKKFFLYSEEQTGVKLSL